MTGDRTPVPVFQVERLVRMVGADSAFICEVLASFRATAPGMLQALAEAVRGGDAAALVSAAHRMKGSCATIGAEALAQTCEHLEAVARRRRSNYGDDIPELLKRAEAQLVELFRVLEQHCPEPTSATNRGSSHDD